MFGRWKRRALEAEGCNREYQAMVRTLSEHLAIYQAAEVERLAMSQRQAALKNADLRMNNYCEARFDLLHRELGDADKAALAVGADSRLLAAGACWTSVKRTGDIHGSEADAFLALVDTLAPRDAEIDGIFSGD